MTQREKIEMLKQTIVVLFEKEGRSKSYISRLLDVNRYTLTDIMNNEWKLERANVRHMIPSNRKFLNKHKNLIKSRLDNDITIKEISKELGVDRCYLPNTIIPQDNVLKKALSDYHNRIGKNAEERVLSLKSKSSFNYNIEHIDGEVWVDILGYEGYQISNKARVKKHISMYDDYMLMKPAIHPISKRLYVSFEGKTFHLSRLVGFNFVQGHSEEKNTINHIDRDVQNNAPSNLEWVSQSENNQHAYDTGRSKVIAYQKNGKFKKIIMDGKYEFKTIVALAKFLGKSTTQTGRYLDGSAKSQHSFEFIY